jgi:hypothetical protein
MGLHLLPPVMGVTSHEWEAGFRPRCHHPQGNVIMALAAGAFSIYGVVVMGASEAPIEASRPLFVFW